MLYEKFEIKNYKGIRNAEISIDPTGNARVYSLVGLNESGKTTLLEAIHSFSPDADTEIVVGNVTSLEEQIRQRVPKNRISDFNEAVTVTAHIRLQEGDLEKLQEYCKEEGFEIDISSVPKSFTYTRGTNFKNGVFERGYRNTNFPCRVRKDEDEEFQISDWGDEKSIIVDYLWSRFPIIAYFPTFLFDFPQKIFLSEQENNKVNDFYKKLFQDILDFDKGRGYNIETHIIDKLRQEEINAEYAEFMPVYQKSGIKEQIAHITNRAEEVVTNVVLKKWNEIFGDDETGKKVEIEFDVEESSETENDDGTISKNHDLYIEFYVREGSNRFPIKDRSLGFRWFFSFLLFTQFRAARNDDIPILFLLDEPASNLHAGAQCQLIKSFPEIAKHPHTLIYSTHSHYMIDPNWLEQCYIVKNEIGTEQPVSLEETSINEDAYDVQAIRYPTFVSQNPDANKISYFQPIIDRLDVVPSKFDFNKPSIIVEGKSDYFIISYFAKVHLKKDVNLIPAHGASGMAPLIAIHKGWGLSVKILLDSDKAGTQAKKRYIDEFILQESDIVMLEDFDTRLKKIESILEPEDHEALIAKPFNRKKASKKDIMMYFQTHLAGDKKIKLSQEATKKAVKLINGLIKFQKS